MLMILPGNYPSKYLCYHILVIVHYSGFVQTLESPEIKMLRFSGLDWKVLGKSIGPGKPWKSPGILK